MTATVTPNPQALGEIEKLADSGLRQWGQFALGVMQDRVATDTSGLHDSLDFTEPAWDGDVLSITFHDGPGRDGRTYGIAVELGLPRGINPQQPFMRSAVDQNLGAFADIMAKAFAPAVGRPARPAWPAAHGDWAPGGSKTYQV